MNRKTIATICGRTIVCILTLFVAGLLVQIPIAHAQFLGPSVGPALPATAPLPVSEYPEIRIAPGDIVSIAALGAPELTTLMQTPSGSIYTGSSSPIAGIRVGSRGEVNIPYAGSIVLAGLTPNEAGRVISQSLKEKGILVDPQVTVQLVDSPMRVITVIGEVLKPAPVPGFGHLRLLDAISACGGFTPMASHTITIRRSGIEEPILVNLGNDPQRPDIGNIPLLPGDTIIVPTVGRVFVLGQVKTPQSVSLSGNTPITAMRAVAMAGGVNYSAALSRARVIRTTRDNRQVEIMFDLSKVMNGKQQDVMLASDDVLYIPANTFKAILSGGGAQIAASSLQGSAIFVNAFK
jgi:polysaccharide export outer membrane protein